MKTLIMTVGLPQSGKSTWAQKQSHPIVNPDSIRLALHGKPFIGLAEPFVWAIAKVIVRSQFLAGHSAEILDATHTTRKRRDEWKSRDWVRTFVEFPETPEVCKERAKKTAINPEHESGLVGAIERMADQFEEVDVDAEGEE